MGFITIAFSIDITISEKKMLIIMLHLLQSKLKKAPLMQDVDGATFDMVLLVLLPLFVLLYVLDYIFIYEGHGFWY